MQSDRDTRTFLVAVASTLVIGALAAVVVRYIANRTAENLARLAAGESDWERHHPTNA